MNKNQKLKQFKEWIILKETISILIIVAFLIAALASIFIGPSLYLGKTQEGDIALKNIYAPYDFTYFWEIDGEKTSEAKDAAKEKVPYVLKRDSAAEKKAIEKVSSFFDAFGKESAPEASLAEKASDIKRRTRADLSERNIEYLLEYPDISLLKKKALDVLGKVFLAGYIDDGTLKQLKEKGVSKVVIFNSETNAETERTIDSIVTAKKIQETAIEYASAEFKDDRKVRQPAASLISEYVSPNLIADEKETEAKRGAAIEKVKPIYHSWTVEKNELIIEKGTRVTDRNVAQISQIRRVFRPGVTPTLFLGVLLLFLLLGLVAVIYISFIQGVNFLQDTKGVAIVLINMLFMIIAADFIVHLPQPSYFIPVSGMAMLIALLVGSNIAFIAAVLMSLCISLLIGGGIEVALVLIVGSIVGIFVVRDARRRTRILWAGFLVGLTKFLTIACIGLINEMDVNFYITDGAWGIAGGILSGFIVMGLLPVFEHLFKIPTNISLLELSDLNHPLLKKLAMEAPGTYHHSIMVGNLAEAACDAIGANSLLARVGAYYHDIGKIPKAEYFSENEMGSGSKHAKLAPSMSALIIAKHVKEGEQIARKYKLNSAITDFIRQHHGDSMISYFYQKAMEKAEEGTMPKEENFRYPGPRPQTKESAIILLADAVEASSRALDEPTASSIRHLVKKIINNKFIDGQLDECALTLKDMHIIAESFLRVLMGVFHTRLNYPEESKKQSEEKPANGNKNKQRKFKQKKKD